MGYERAELQMYILPGYFGVTKQYIDGVAGESLGIRCELIISRLQPFKSVNAVSIGLAFLDGK
jgi:hypothetical protein